MQKQFDKLNTCNGVLFILWFIARQCEPLWPTYLVLVAVTLSFAAFLLLLAAALRAQAFKGQRRLKLWVGLLSVYYAAFAAMGYITLAA